MTETWRCAVGKHRRLATPLVRAVAVGAILASAFALGVIATTERPAVSIHPLITPPSVMVAAPAVTVLPAPVALPPPVAPPAPPPPEPPRAIAPTIDASCVLEHGDDAPPVCAWDDGFPAISSDGTELATKAWIDDPGRGNPGLEIRFVDPDTSRVLRRRLILSPDEVDPTRRDQLQRKIARRVAAVQRVLDQRGFRTLQPLGSSDEYTQEVTGDRSTFHAEFAGATARVIDPTTRSVLWQHDFGVPRSGPPGDNNTDMCGGWQFRSISLWWDRPSGLVLASSIYTTGGCMCDSSAVESTARIPAHRR